MKATARQTTDSPESKRLLGIHGIGVREPVGVAISIRPRSAKTGTPTSASGKGGTEDRFFLMTTESPDKQFTSGKGKVWSAPTRAPHPAFAAWNAAARSLEASTATLFGNFIRAEWQNVFEYVRRAQRLEGWPSPPDRKPACRGDGITAIRFGSPKKGAAPIFYEMACPNELCEFAISGACRPWARIYFRLRWPEPWQHLPSLVAKWTTTSWHAIESVLGLLELVLGTEAVRPEAKEKKVGLAQSLGLDSVSLFGLPFVMNLSQRTKPSIQARFPVVDFSPDGDLMEWLLRQRRQLDFLGGKIALLPSPDSPEERHVEDDDFVSLAGGIPGEVVEAEYEAPETQEEPTEMAEIDWTALEEEVQKVGGDPDEFYDLKATAVAEEMTEYDVRKRLGLLKDQDSLF